MALSHKVYMLMVQMVAPVGCENFLMVFGTPTLLWRVMHFAGYHEPPLYHWNEEYLEAAMVRGAANYTSPHPSTLLAGMEGGIRRENSLGGYPSSGL